MRAKASKAKTCTDSRIKPPNVYSSNISLIPFAKLNASDTR